MGDSRRAQDSKWARAVRELTAGLLTLLVLALHAGPVRAQGSASDKAAAEALFDEGLRLMREGKYDQACERLERSQSIEHGLGTMLYLADCYERTGRTASAWALFREAASLADAEGQSERADSGRRRASALKPHLSWLTVEVPADNVVDGLAVTRDGEPMPSGAWGSAIPVDPGGYEVVAEAPGFDPWSATVQVGQDGDRVRVRVPRLTPSSEPAVADAPPEDGEAGAETPGEPATQTRSKLRLAALTIGSVGLATVAAGGVLGGLAISRNNEATDLCQGTSCDSQQGVNASDDARTFANASTGLWVAGGALVAAGVVLFFTDPARESRSAEVAPSLGPRHAGLSVRGKF